MKNAVLYTIESIDHEAIKFTELPSTFSFNEVKEFFRLSYARTIQSCQGTEFDGGLTIWESQCPRFTLRHLCAALSRAKANDLVQIA